MLVHAAVLGQTLQRTSPHTQLEIEVAVPAGSLQGRAERFYGLHCILRGCIIHRRCVSVALVSVTAAQLAFADQWVCRLIAGWCAVNIGCGNPSDARLCHQFRPQYHGYD